MAVMKIVVVLALLCVAATMADTSPYGSAQESGEGGDHDNDDDDYYEVPKYQFAWEVDEDDNQFQQQEERDDDNTKGSYSVDLPDGRRQTVTYYVDGDSGYVAEVSYEGEAEYAEESEEESRQSYDN